MTIGSRVKVTVNWTTRIGTIIKVQRNGKVVVLTDEIQNDNGTRRYAAQRFTVEPKYVVVL